MSYSIITCFKEMRNIRIYRCNMSNEYTSTYSYINLLAVGERSCICHFKRKVKKARGIVLT